MPDAPALLLISNAAVPTAMWDTMIPRLAAEFHVIRVDLLGHGRSAGPASRYDIPTHARKVGQVLDLLGITRVTVVGHSSGCTVVTALAEQRPALVTAMILIDFGSTPAAKIPEPLTTRLLVTTFPGRLLWRLRNENTLRKAAENGFTRPVDIPEALVEHLMGMTHQSMVGSLRAPLAYLGQRSLPDRLTALGLPLLVIFGEADQRWRSSCAADYRAVPGARIEMLPGVGHIPMLEDPETTAALLRDFATI